MFIQRGESPTSSWLGRLIRKAGLVVALSLGLSVLTSGGLANAQEGAVTFRLDATGIKVTNPCNGETVTYTSGEAVFIRHTDPLQYFEVVALSNGAAVGETTGTTYRVTATRRSIDFPQGSGIDMSIVKFIAEGSSLSFTEVRAVKIIYDANGNVVVATYSDTTTCTG
jgi:hypothetical protein